MAHQAVQCMSPMAAVHVCSQSVLGSRGRWGTTTRTNATRLDKRCSESTAAASIKGALQLLGNPSNLPKASGTAVQLAQRIVSQTRVDQKRGLLCCSLTDDRQLLINANTATFVIQRRGFRSQRPNQSQGGIGTTRSQSQQQSTTVLGSIGNIFSKHSKSNTLAKKELEAATTSAANLKLLLETQKTAADKERIKVAFADGFVAGTVDQTTTKTSWATKWKNELKFLAAFTFVLSENTKRGPDIGSRSARFKCEGRMGADYTFAFGFPLDHEVSVEDVTVTFDDARGVDEAKDDLAEIVSYLREPEKYSRLGARLPKGVLLVGSPGTGKTLLARAIAGEAGVPIFYASGSEFDEALVGQGARRIRDLFAAAKTRSPCVVFIDELDSVGSKRTGSALHPYASQTINQLLTEMDGFNKNEGIIVIGATNRRDDLDKALLRPGRFDVEVVIARPDLKGRTEIFSLYLDKIVQCGDVKKQDLAKRTVGFTGAQIENLVNQAALRAAADGYECVNMEHLNEAKDRIMMGRERKAGRIPDEEANRATAYHEAGHALVSYHTTDATPLHKCTIIPRGASMGHTAFTPQKEEYSITRSQLLAQMDTAMGGRVAEELIFGNDRVTTGAADDLKQATRIATMMVKNFGMSEKVGLRDFDVLDEGVSLFGRPNELGPQAASEIDSEIRRLLQESYERAKQILQKQAKQHHRLADALLQHETLDASEMTKVINGEPLTDSTASQAKKRDILQKAQQQSDKSSVTAAVTQAKHILNTPKKL